MQATTAIAFYFFSTVLKAFGVESLTVRVPVETIAVKGSPAVLEIGYTLSSGENFNSVALKRGIQDVFKAPTVVAGRPVLNGSFSGNYVSRGSTNYYFGRTQFTITLSQVTTSDEGQYTVEMTRDQNIAVYPVHTQIVLDVLPGTPSISVAPTQSVLGGAGPTVFLCTANLGKPQASMVWSRRVGNYTFGNIADNVTTSTSDNNDGTTSGTSTLTVNLDSADDGVQFTCQVTNRQATLSAETGPIKVIDGTQPVNPLEP